MPVIGTEIVGNIAPGGAITRGLARAGVKSTLGQAAAGGGVGGALYGASQSDTLSELPVNTIAGGVGGTVTAGALNKAITTAGNIVSPLGRRILERTGSKDFSLPNFIKSLANKDNTKTLQSAGKSGQQNIIEEARVLSDRIKSMYGRNGEVVDSELNNMLKLPQMKKAEEEYAKYIAENGDVILPEGVMNAIYERHPEALIFLQQAKRVNPSRFRNIEPNSIAELNELKEMIGKYVKNPNKSGL